MHGSTGINLRRSQIEKLFYRFYEYQLLKTPLYFRPLFFLYFIQLTGVSVEILMKRSQKKNISGWHIHELSQFLHEVKFTLRIILGSMLQHLAKLINEDNQEFSPALQFVILGFEFIQNAISSAINREFLTQQNRQFLIVANNFKNFKLLLL
ncbi:Uncharacterised protein [Segatella copri]|nr:Uncharacterised protein [Segatella copri]